MVAAQRRDRPEPPASVEGLAEFHVTGVPVDWRDCTPVPTPGRGPADIRLPARTVLAHPTERPQT